MLLLCCLWPIDATVWPYLLQKTTDVFVTYDQERSSIWQHLHLVIGGALALWIGVEVGFRTSGFIMARLFPKISAELRMALFDHVQHHSPHYFHSRFAGSLSNKISDMVNQFDWLLGQFYWTFWTAFVGCLLVTCVLGTIHPLFGLILGLWVLLHFTLCILFAKKCAHYEEIHGEARTHLVGRIVDSFTNHVAVNVLYRFRFEKAFVQKSQDRELTTNIQAKTYVEWMRLCLGLCSVVLSGVGVNGLMIFLWSKGEISTGQMVQIFTTTWNLIMLVWMAGSEIPTLFQAIGMMRQAFTVMQDPQDILDTPSAQPLQITEGAITFSNVCFRYGENRKLFEKKSISIPGGEKVGLVGYSGAGKSTFVNLILRLYTPVSGHIEIDGQDISKVTLESLRKNLSLIPQDPTLFHRSLRDNIRYGRLDASDDEVIEASKKAHCHEFISALPQGYETLVGERGAKLSGGERQRIAIARAILANAPILLLDEASSALDSLTESYIQESLFELMQDKTTLVIAHRLSTLEKMDRLLVFDQGKIVEEGTHSSLLRQKGLYATMWQMQSAGFIS